MVRLLLRRSLATRSNITIRPVTVQCSTRNTSTSALYGISALSNRHETQHFYKLSRLPLMEHSPTLKLIHTSEVAPGASPATSSSLPVDSSMKQESDVPEQTKQEGHTLEQMMSQRAKQVRGSIEVWNEKAVSAGRAVISDYGREIKGLNKLLDLQNTMVVNLKQQLVDERTHNERKQYETARYGYHSHNGQPLTKDEHDTKTSRRNIEIWAKIFLYLIACGVAVAVGFKAGAQTMAVTREHKVVAQGAESSSENSKANDEVESKDTVDRIVQGILDTSHAANLAEQQRMLAEQQQKLDRSWTSLLWKKQ
jgi:phosphate/sulfate permease